MNVIRPTVTKRITNAASMTTHSTTTNGSIADVDEDEYTALIYDSIIDDLLVKRRTASNSISLSSDSYYHEGSSVYSAFSSPDISTRKKGIATVKSIDSGTRHSNHSKGICNGVSSNTAGRNSKPSPAVQKKPIITSVKASYVQNLSMSSSIMSASADASEVGQLYLNSIDCSQSTTLSGYQPSMDNNSTTSMRSARAIVDESASLIADGDGDGDGEISSSQAFYLEVERCTAGIRAKLQMIDDLDHLDNNCSSSSSSSLEDQTPLIDSELIPPAASFQTKRDSPTTTTATSSIDNIPTPVATSREEAVEAAEASMNATTASPSSLASASAYVEPEVSILDAAAAVAPVLAIETMIPPPPLLLLLPHEHEHEHWMERMNSTEIYDNIADVDDSITMNSPINFKHAMADIGIKELVLKTSMEKRTSDADDDDDAALVDGSEGDRRMMKEEEGEGDDEYAQVLSSLMNDAMRVKGLSISGGWVVDVDIYIT